MRDVGEKGMVTYTKEEVEEFEKILDLMYNDMCCNSCTDWFMDDTQGNRQLILDTLEEDADPPDFNNRRSDRPLIYDYIPIFKYMQRKVIADIKEKVFKPI